MLKRFKKLFPKKKGKKKNVGGPKKGGQSDLDERFANPDVSEYQEEQETLRVDRNLHFGRESGQFSSTYEKSTVTELKIINVKIKYRIEVVTDLITGQVVRADQGSIRPPKFSLTWDSTIKLAQLAIHGAIPINRLSSIFSASQNKIHPSKIERNLVNLAEFLLQPYLALPGQLADSDIISGDDMPSRVLETEKKNPDDPKNSTKKDPTDIDLPEAVAEILGHTHPKKRDPGNQKKINVSLAIGQTNPSDFRSTIIFYRTHRGHFGDLLYHILQDRSPKQGPIVIQSDLSSANMSRLSCFKNKFNITQAGCTAHSRRPFFRYRELEEQGCYFFLRCFALLANVESSAIRSGGDPPTVLRYRKKYSTKIWDLIIKEAKNIVTGRKIYCHGRWPPKSKIHNAAAYILRNIGALTLHLTDPRINPTNNLVERLLRPEKLMLNGSKFRKSETMRVTYDILRTMMQTCRAADVAFNDYCQWVVASKTSVKNNPDHYTPYAYRLFLDQKVETSKKDNAA